MSSNSKQFVPEGLPWVNVHRGLTEATAGGAAKACKDFGVGYRLISNSQWQSVARNAENVASNWSGGAEGSGVLNRGHSDQSPSPIIANSADDTDGYFGTGNTGFKSASWSGLGASPAEGADQKRTHTLGNGNVVWDFGGNIQQWVSEDYSTLKMSPAYPQPTEEEYSFTKTFPVSGVNRLNFAPGGSYSSSQSVGYSIGGDFGAVLCGVGSPVASLFAAALYTSPGDSNDSIGFRCAFLP